MLYHARAWYSYTAMWRKEYLGMLQHATANSASSYTTVKRKDYLDNDRQVAKVSSLEKLEHTSLIFFQIYALNYSYLHPIKIL